MSLSGYRIDISDTSGNLLEQITAPISVRLERRVNWFDNHALGLPDYGEIDLDTLFVKDAIVEVYRRVSGTWYPAYAGFHRTPEHVIQQDDQRVFWSYGRSYNDLIRRRGIGYPAERMNPYVTKSGPAETVLKQFVSENMTLAAVSPPRVRRGYFTGLTLTIEGDAGLGPNWAGQRSNKMLIDVLQEIATTTGVDFSIRRTGGMNFEFYTGYPQLGQDLSATIQFSPTLGNMATPSYTVSATEEGNIAIVLGQGQGSARRTDVLSSGAENDTPFNDIEFFVDARGESTYDGLQQVGRDALEERAAKESFKFQVLQTGRFLYGRDYDLGDVVTGVFGAVVRQKKIIGATIFMNNDTDDEEVTLEFGDLPS